MNNSGQTLQKFKKYLFYFIMVLFFFGCNSEQNDAAINEYTYNQISHWNKVLNKVIVNDIFTPPVASRIFAYTNIAAYEVLCKADSSSKSFHSLLNDMPEIPNPNPSKSCNLEVASVIAFSTVSQNLVYAKNDIKTEENIFLKKLEEIGLEEETLNNSIEYGRMVGEKIISWAGEDGYKERASLPGYQVKLDDPSAWKPTPPGYADAIEPNWYSLRPFVLSSANQFEPEPPTPFDTSSTSDFYKETQEVYKAVKNLNEEHIEIARFWNCNPNISHTQGHIMYFRQQMSPGAHWMLIGSDVVRKENLEPLKASKTLAILGLSIADSFISCWQSKFQYSVIRPETYINLYIDPDWQPILQTPPFPEYTSGHSVASSTAATILTELFGENYKFIDSSEVAYGLPNRKYSSFREASNEAAISRLYGGIHYLPSINNGITQGNNVGFYIVKELVQKL